MDRVQTTESTVPRKGMSADFKIIMIIILCIVGGGFLYAKLRADEHHASERRQWKNAAIIAITNDLKDPDHLKKRFGEIPNPRDEWDKSEWMTSDTIVCKNGAWLAYRSQTHKVDPKVYDIFVARASDGNWYYSDYHFCIGAMVLMSNGQPESLDQMKKHYFLVQFDGSSDDALRPTWNHHQAEQ